MSMKTVLRGVSYNRACYHLEAHQSQYGFKTNSPHFECRNVGIPSIGTTFWYRGEMVGRYFEKSGKLQVREVI